MHIYLQKYSQWGFIHQYVCLAQSNTTVRGLKGLQQEKKKCIVWTIIIPAPLVQILHGYSRHILTVNVQ